MNKVILMGRLTKDPEIRYTQTTNTAQCGFTLAVDRRFKAQDGTTKSDFINCVAWRNTAEFINKYFTKGMRMLVTGSIQVRDYENSEGKKVYVTEVIVDEAEFCESKNAGNNGGAQNTYNTPVDTAPKGDTFSQGSDSGFFQMEGTDSCPF